MSSTIPLDLAEARAEIDTIDRGIIALLARRQRIVEQVVAIKQREKLPARIPERVDEVIDNAAALATAAGMSPALARTVWRAMVEWFIRHEDGQLQD